MSTQTDITLNVNDKLTINLKLEVGDVQQEVTVQAAPIAVELQSPVQGALVNGMQIHEPRSLTPSTERAILPVPGPWMAPTTSTAERI